MKKYLFITISAALALTACTNETTEYVGDTQAREIAFAPLAQKPTRAAVQTATLPSQDMFVVAYQASTPAKEYFGKTTFTKGATYWGASKYWPLSESTINFFAVTGITSANTAHVSFPATSASEGTKSIESATVAYTTANSYAASSQQDIMYSVGQGAVTKSGNTLTFPEKVDMTFYHAMAMINFQVKANSAVEASGGSGAITINNIKLNGAQYTGTLTITNNTACTTTNTQVKPTISWVGETAPTGENRPNVPNVPSTLSTTFAPASESNWACLMVIPSTFESFTINFTVDGNTYDYTYVPGGFTDSTPNTTSLTAGNKYTYQITFKLHEIEINPIVDTWTDNNNSITVAN